MMNNFLLPSAESVTANPHKMLPKLLHQQGNGVGRAYQDATLLADAILEAAVVRGLSGSVAPSPVRFAS
jgi:hypothetical protein